MSRGTRSPLPNRWIGKTLIGCSQFPSYRPLFTSPYPKMVNGQSGLSPSGNITKSYTCAYPIDSYRRSAGRGFGDCIASSVRSTIPMSKRRFQIMARALSLSLLFLVFASTMKGQETPQYELFVGPSYAREDLTNVRFINGIGWHASLDGTANNWLSAVFDFSGYYTTPKAKLPGLPTAIPIDSSTICISLALGLRTGDGNGSLRLRKASSGSPTSDSRRLQLASRTRFLQERSQLPSAGAPTIPSRAG